MSKENYKCELCGKEEPIKESVYEEGEICHDCMMIHVVGGYGE